MDYQQTKYAHFSDDELLTLLKEGDHVGYAEIYRRYARVLAFHIYKMLQDQEAAKDVVHELFTHLWYKRHVIQVHRSLSSYLYASARNRVLDRIARTRLENQYIESIQDFARTQSNVTDHLVRERELQMIIDQEITALPPRMRLIFELSRKEHLSHKEIAEQLGISEKTVKKQVNNALKILRTKLGELVILIGFLDVLP